MKKLRLFLGMFFLLTIIACGQEGDTPQENVKISVAFGKTSAVQVYDKSGTMVASSTDGHLNLKDGVYYAKVQDEEGNETFDTEGRLMFLPVINNGPANTDPQSVDWSDTPVFKFTVANNTVVSDYDTVPTTTNENDSGDVKRQLYSGAPTGARGRLLWELTKSMIGPYGIDNYQWNTTSTLATFPYTSEDVGAWNALRNSPAYYNNGTIGWYVSCRADNDSNNNIGYNTCSIAWGADNVSEYVQQKIPNGPFRGGQCKAFSNLVAYRSGVYHGTNWSFKALPSDTWLKDQQNLNKAPFATPATIQAGDILRMVDGHSAITARVINSYTVIVGDSNFVGGDGKEQVASHVLSFSGSGYNNLGNYHRLNCIYDASPC